MPGYRMARGLRGPTTVWKAQNVLLFPRALGDICSGLLAIRALESGDRLAMDFLNASYLHYSVVFYGVPTGIRTPVTAVKGQCPRPLDDRDSRRLRGDTGGGSRDRTDDLLHAMQALSQLSYTPTGAANYSVPPPVKKESLTRERLAALSRGARGLLRAPAAPAPRRSPSSVPPDRPRSGRADGQAAPVDIPGSPSSGSRAAEPRTLFDGPGR